MSERLRILMLVFNMVGRGTYRRAFQFGRHLALRGHAVTLVATSERRRSGVVGRVDGSMTIVEAPDLLAGSLRSGWDIWNALWRIGATRTGSFDVVHAFESRPTVLVPALYWREHRRVPLVMDWADWFGCGGSVEERPNRMMRALLRPVETFFEEHFRTRADATTAICTTLQSKAISLGVRPDTITLIPNGSDVDQFHPIDARDARRRVGLPLDAPIIGYVGSMFQRDAQLMVMAFERVHARMPDALLLVVGYFPFDMRIRVTCPDAVIQTSRVTDSQLSDYLASCDLCWLPLCDSNANRGRWPMKLNDYMAAGRPTVATRVGDVTPLFEQEPIGLLAPDEPAGLAEVTVGLLRDPDKQAAMGKRARHVAETHFNWAKLTERLERTYHTCK